MANLDDFLAYLETQVANHDVYWWGGSGEFVGNLTIGNIITKEQTPKHAAEMLRRVAQNIELGYDYSKMRAFDCSGLIVEFLLQQKLIKGDMTANDIKNICQNVRMSEIIPGDFVFSCYDSGKAYHIGTYIGDGMVIEAAGRSLGVVKRKISANKWNHVGRPPFWKVALKRKLKIESPHMVGDDVKILQTHLINLGYSVGKSGADGDYGQNTADAVTQYQIDKNLAPKVPGMVAKKTAESLGFIWEG